VKSIFLNETDRNEPKMCFIYPSLSISHIAYILSTEKQLKIDVSEFLPYVSWQYLCEMFVLLVIVTDSMNSCLLKLSRLVKLSDK
jgi:hypothetical protein